MARAMFHEMMMQVLTRLPDYRVIEDGLVLYPTQGNQTGWDAIPAVFTAGPRMAALTGPLPTMVRPTPLTVTAIETVAQNVHSVRLAHPDGLPLPAWTPGSHLEIRLPSGRVRQYSLCGDPERDKEWRIAVLREAGGRGGSMELCDTTVVGTSLSVRGPRNHFPLVDAPAYLFLAGGIGVTPILAMARQAATAGARFQVVYGGRNRASMAFADELAAVAGDRLILVPQDECGLPDLAGFIAKLEPGAVIYACGPAPMLAAAERACEQLDRIDSLHIERFSGDALELPGETADNRPFDVQLARTGVTLHVPADQRMIEVIRKAVPGLSYDCEKGYCGACETRVLAGGPEHRDSILNDEERAEGRTMMICVGRCRSERLVLDL